MAINQSSVAVETDANDPSGRVKRRQAVDSVLGTMGAASAHLLRQHHQLHPTRRIDLMEDRLRGLLKILRAWPWRCP